MCNKGITQCYTCHPHTNHTCLHSPAARHHRPLASAHCAYLRRDGQAELTWPHTEINAPHRELNPDTITHLSTNRARRWLTSLIEANALTTTPDHRHAWVHGMGVDHGGDRGTRPPPRIWSRVTLMQIVPPDFVIYTVFQKKHPLILLAISWGIVVRFQ